MSVGAISVINHAVSLVVYFLRSVGRALSVGKHDVEPVLSVGRSVLLTGAWFPPSGIPPHGRRCRTFGNSIGWLVRYPSEHTLVASYCLSVSRSVLHSSVQGPSGRSCWSIRRVILS